MTNTPTIAAGLLDDVQKRQILSARRLGASAYLLPRGIRGLATMGIAVRSIDGMYLSPLGLEVRTLLEQRP